MKLKYPLLLITLVVVLGSESSPGDHYVKYCQPGENCWPTAEETMDFLQSLTPADPNICDGGAPYYTEEQNGGMIPNYWSFQQPAEFTLYEFYQFRNRWESWSSPIVVIPKYASDVQKTVDFAVKHNIGISVFGTGHEFNDRNAGPGNNTILIRTVCLRDVDFDLDPNNKFQHPDGIARVGSGMTWGTSLFGNPGVQDFADKEDRLVVTGHAGQVGVVGWTLGGGHGQLVPWLGAGSDQLLEAELVGADGSFKVANKDGTWITKDGITKFTENNDLFWALRGGGGSSWGIITALTIKVYKNRQPECTKDCIQQTQIKYYLNFAAPDFEESFVNIIGTFFEWTHSANEFWSGYINIYPLSAESLFIGQDLDYVGMQNDEQWQQFLDVYENLYPNNRTIEIKSWNTWLEKTKGQGYESISTVPNDKSGISIMINQTMLTRKLAQEYYDETYGRFMNHQTCAAGSQILMTFPNQKSVTQDTPLSDEFRQARIQLASSLVILPDMSQANAEENANYVNNQLSWKYFQWGPKAYFSESNYYGSDWWYRYWSAENYMNLLKIKGDIDPNRVFYCRHCIGDYS